MRHWSWSIVSAVVVICVSPRGYAVMDAATVVDQHLDSRGGDDRILGLQAYHMRGTISQAGHTLPLQIWWKRPNKLRVDIGSGVSTIKSAYDGHEAWTIEPGPWGSEVTAITPGLRELFIRQADFEGPLLDSEKKGIRVVPDANLWGDSGYLFQVYRRTDKAEQVFLNSSMRLMAREVFEVGPPGFEHQVEQRYSKFRRIEGFALPHRIERFVDGGSLDAIIDIGEVRMLPSVPESLFSKPAVHYPRTAEPRLTDLTDLSVLSNRFRVDEGAVRLVAILSPTASSSRRELLNLRALLDSARANQVAAYVVFTPILENDCREAAAARVAESVDPRTTYLWDSQGTASRTWRGVLAMNRNPLSICCFYGPEAKWDALPTAPNYYWTDPGLGNQGAVSLNRSQGLVKFRELLAMSPLHKKRAEAKRSQTD